MGTLAAASLATVTHNGKVPRTEMFGKSQLAASATIAPIQLSQMDGRKILQFLSDRKGAADQADSNAVSKKKHLSSTTSDTQRAQTETLLANLGATAISTTTRAENENSEEF